jgi:hypothetical protein
VECPAYFGAVGEARPNALLGELTAEIRRPVPGSEPLIVYSWPVSLEGRKLFGGAANAYRFDARDASGRRPSSIETSNTSRKALIE